MKLTIKEYAKTVGISTQAVYQQLHKQTLKYELIDGKKYIIVDESLKQVAQPMQSRDSPMVADLVKDLQKELRRKNKQIKQLTKKLDKRDKQLEKLNKKLVQSVENEKHTLLSFINEQKKLIEHKEHEIIDTEIKPKKKKKKGKKWKKNS